jgi:hypothetical protein
MVKRKRIHCGYSVHPDQVNRVLSSQGGMCDICKCSLSYNDSRIDHNHDTGALRGLLCHHCNVMLGFAKDDIRVLQDAINYLNKHAKPIRWPEPLPRKPVINFDWKSILSYTETKYKLTPADIRQDRRSRVRNTLKRLRNKS